MQININLPDIYNMAGLEPDRWQRIMDNSWSLQPGDMEAFINANDIADSFWVLHAHGLTELMRTAAMRMADMEDEVDVADARYTGTDRLMVRSPTIKHDSINMYTWCVALAEGVLNTAYNVVYNKAFKTIISAGVIVPLAKIGEVAKALKLKELKQILIATIKEAT